MRRSMLVVLLGSFVVEGCTVSAYPPRERVVEREVVDQNGNVVERDRYYVESDDLPAARVEVIPIRPYPDAIWIRGYWVREGRRRWAWVPGHWR